MRSASPTTVEDALFAVRDLLHDAGWQPEAVDSPTLTVDFVVEGVEFVVTVTSDPLRFEDAQYDELRGHALDPEGGL